MKHIYDEEKMKFLEYRDYLSDVNVMNVDEFKLWKEEDWEFWKEESEEIESNLKNGLFKRDSEIIVEHLLKIVKLKIETYLKEESDCEKKCSVDREENVDFLGCDFDSVILVEECDGVVVHEDVRNEGVVDLDIGVEDCVDVMVMENVMVMEEVKNVDVPHEECSSNWPSCDAPINVKVTETKYSAVSSSSIVSAETSTCTSASRKKMYSRLHQFSNFLHCIPRFILVVRPVFCIVVCVVYELIPDESIFLWNREPPDMRVSDVCLSVYYLLI